MKWISIKDKLPDNNVEVLLCNRYGIIIAVRKRDRDCSFDHWETNHSEMYWAYDGENEFEALCRIDIDMFEPTHWAPLLKLPSQ